MVKLELTISGAKSIIRVLDHVVRQANGTGQSGYAIDELCRADSAKRWSELRGYINSRLPKKYRL